MKESLWPSLGVKARINIYDSIAEGDNAAGREGAVLDECNKNLVYRGPLADFREQFVDLLEAETGIARKMRDSGKKRDTGRKDEAGKPIEEPILVPDETEGDYVKRIRAERSLSEDDPWVAFAQPIADRVGVYEEKDGRQVRVGNLVVDIKEPERKASGPKKLPDMYKAAAGQILTNGTQDAWVERLKTENSITVTLSGDRAKDEITLGWAIKAREDAKRKAAVAEYK